MNELMKVKREIMPSIRKNREREKSNTYYSEMLTESLVNRSDSGSIKKTTDHLESIIDIRFEKRLFRILRYSFLVTDLK